MKLQINGVVKFYYDKVGSDGTNIPSSGTYSPCVYEDYNITIGLICCMDINNPTVYSPVKEIIEKSKCKYKVIAISAYMTDNSWFSGESLQPYLCGFNVVLSNGCNDGPQSFITDAKGQKLSSLEMELGKLKLINCGIT